MRAVVCVLKSGGVYGPEWVYALIRALSRSGSQGFQFFILTDIPTAVDATTIPLMYGLPGWWSKVEIFRPGLWGALEAFAGEPITNVLYLDLDTLPVGDISDLLTYDGPLAMLSDFYRPELAQSGVMAFAPGELTASIWEHFIADPAKHMKDHRGDGEFLHHLFEGQVDRLQFFYPKQVVSLKAHAKAGPPEGARLVCGHGLPRLSDPSAGWAHTVWASQ